MDFCLQKGFKGQQKEGVTHYFRGILKNFANYISIFATTCTSRCKWLQSAKSR